MIVIGAGLVGCLWAIMARRQSRPVTVYEKRPDMRRQSEQAGRSINLVVTARGMAALQEVGLWEGVRRLCLPVSGRMMHSRTGELTWRPYGRDPSECNYSISRGELNKFLLDEACRAGAEVVFERPLRGVDLAAAQLDFGDIAPVPFERLYGADGADSVVRKSLGVRWHMEELAFGYKELLMPAASGGKHPMEAKALHIWPRGEHMLMALPNLDGSFTMTLYAPKEVLRELDCAPKAREFFRRGGYGDALELMPDAPAELPGRPLGRLGTIHCDPWNAAEQAVLLGDAAHAIVPFFGQGMNCGFEDCRLLARWERERPREAFATYQRLRREDGQAIAEMALENFVEMRDRVGDGRFLLRKQVDAWLEQTFPDYRTRYALVVYSHLPYAKARAAGEVQRGILDELCKGLKDFAALDRQRACQLVERHWRPFVKKNSLARQLF